MTLISIDPEKLPENVIKLSSIQEKVIAAIVTSYEVIDIPPICFEVMDGDLSSEIGTLGNISLWQGKAKQGKTFALSMALAAAEVGDWIMEKLKVSLPDNQKTVILFDTEQSRYHVQRVIKRICKLSNRVEPNNLITYNLRKYNPAERLEIVEYVLYNTEGVGFVVIDGIRDLINSINNEEESSMISSKLLKWSEELNCHICSVLHTNKGDNHARGHLGTELTNKAETVISISKDDKDPEQMVVKPEYCRSREFVPFGFRIDDYGIPAINDIDSTKNVGKKALTPVDIEKSTHNEVITSIFKLSKSLKYADLVDQVKDYFMRYGIKFGLNKSKEFITFYINEGLILKVENEGKYPIYKSSLN